MIFYRFLRQLERENRYLKERLNDRPRASDLLMRYAWPGNVRELENAVERAVILSREEAIAPDQLPDAIRELEAKKQKWRPRRFPPASH